MRSIELQSISVYNKEIRPVILGITLIQVDIEVEISC